MSTEHINSGLQRIRAMSAKFSNDTIEAIASHDRSKDAAKQPWFVAGCSDGIGLHTAVAAIDAGILKFGLGVYWEPPHFLELGEDGTPVSPVHFARMQNAMALEAYAASKGASFKVISANVILAPKRDLKGNVKEAAADSLAPELMNAFEAVRKNAPLSDAIFINSVAFGKWISPREGEAAIEVPSLTFNGEIVMMKTKVYHARGYQETLDTMGRNHNLLLRLFKRQNWLGEKSLTSFYTWAGGSQNVDVLRGIYGYGALGDAKIIAESDVAAFRL